MALIEFDQFITPDGVIYNLDGITDRALIRSVDGQGMPPIEYQTQRGPQQHGETVIGYRLRPRILQMVYRRNGANRQDYWDNRSDLLDVLRPNRMTIGGRPKAGTLRKILPDQSLRDIDVVIEQGPDFQPSGDEWDEWSFQEALRLVAHDPTFYDPTVSSLDVSTAANSDLVFPITFPITFGSSIYSVSQNITYAGTWLAYPIITLTGPLLAFVLDNATTGEHLEIIHALADGESMEIDLRYGYKTVEDNSGNNLIGSVSSDSDLGTFHIEADPLAAGGVNQLDFYFSGIGGNTTASLTFNPRYIGI